jgi:hypothetical protein
MIFPGIAIDYVGSRLGGHNCYLVVGGSRRGEFGWASPRESSWLSRMTGGNVLGNLSCVTGALSGRVGGIGACSGFDMYPNLTGERAPLPFPYPGSVSVLGLPGVSGQLDELEGAVSAGLPRFSFAFCAAGF